MAEARTVKLNPDLYECGDCFAEALLDIGHFKGGYEIPLDKLDLFNIRYRQEEKNAHIDQNLKKVR